MLQLEMPPFIRLRSSQDEQSAADLTPLPANGGTGETAVEGMAGGASRTRPAVPMSRQSQARPRSPHLATLLGATGALPLGGLSGGTSVFQAA